MCDTIEDASFKACLYEVSQPGLPGLASLYLASSAYALFFLKIIVVFICKGVYMSSTLDEISVRETGILESKLACLLVLSGNKA